MTEVRRSISYEAQPTSPSIPPTHLSSFPFPLCFVRIKTIRLQILQEFYHKTVIDFIAFTSIQTVARTEKFTKAKLPLLNFSLTPE